jgi:hypothetical protein
MPPACPEFSRNLLHPVATPLGVLAGSAYCQAETYHGAPSQLLSSTSSAFSEPRQLSVARGLEILSRIKLV